MTDPEETMALEVKRLTIELEAAKQEKEDEEQKRADWNVVIEDQEAKIESLEQERARYREALEKIAKEWTYHDVLDNVVDECEAKKIAAQALSAGASEGPAATEKGEEGRHGYG